MMKRIGELKADLRNCITAIRVKDEENARLKAECQARQAENSVLAVECDSLKAEVERLNNESDILQKCCEHQKNRIERLKAEVERLDTLCKQVMSQHSDISCENIMLRKAGDAMASGLQGMAGERPKALADEWHDAKEGKQS
jgi:chromosome segregation ATPase